jgi:hypothetical protein
MESKKILIVFADDHRMESAIEKEFMWKLFTDKYQEKTQVEEIVTANKRFVKYEDGTVIELLPLYSTAGKQCTHLYASEGLFNIAGSKKLATKLQEHIIPSTNFEKEDTLMVFNFVQGEGLEIKSYEK